MRRILEARRICWPDFDRVCAQGGCSYCRDESYRPFRVCLVRARELGLEREFLWSWENLPSGAALKQFVFNADGTATVGNRVIELEAQSV